LIPFKIVITHAPYKKGPRLFRPVRLAYQPPGSSTFLSEQIIRQQSANSTFLSEQISISHQPNEQAVCYSCPVASGAPKMVCKNIVAAIMLPDTLTYIKDLISNTMLFMLSFSRRMESQYLKNTSLFVLSKQPASHRRTLLGSSPLGRLEWRLHRAASALPPPPCRRRRGRPGTRAGPRDGGSGAPFKALRPLRGGGGARRTTAGHGGGGGGEDADLASLRPDPVTPGRIYGGRR
jgi:hypothetical protein